MRHLSRILLACNDYAKYDDLACPPHRRLHAVIHTRLTNAGKAKFPDGLELEGAPANPEQPVPSFLFPRSVAFIPVMPPAHQTVLP